MIAAISTVFSIVVIFLPWDQYDDTAVYYTGIAFLLFLLLMYLFCLIAYYLYTKRLRKVQIKIGGSELTICNGDIFSFDKNYLKVIGFNSHFDTHVGDGIIDPQSLNGIYLKKFYKTSKKINDLNIRIRDDIHLKKLLLIITPVVKNWIPIGTHFIPSSMHISENSAGDISVTKSISERSIPAIASLTAPPTKRSTPPCFSTSSNNFKISVLVINFAGLIYSG